MKTPHNETRFWYKKTTDRWHGFQLNWLAASRVDKVQLLLRDLVNGASKVPNITWRYASHRDSSILRQINRKLLRQSLRLTKTMTSSLTQWYVVIGKIFQNLTVYFMHYHALQTGLQNKILFGLHTYYGGILRISGCALPRGSILLCKLALHFH